MFGSQKYAVRIQLDPQQLAARGIGIDEVAHGRAERQRATCRPACSGAPTRRITVESQGQLTDAAGFRPLVVAYRDGAPVRLGDLGSVMDSVQDTKQAQLVQRRSAPSCSPSSASPAPTRSRWPSGSRTRSTQLRPQLPPSVEMATLYDRSETIRASVHDVKFTLFLTLCLVVMVIFLFLRNVRATIIPSLALPMSLVGTFAVMYLLGYSLDNLSLMALTLAVGFVVDDAIVMLENIVRHIETGRARHGGRAQRQPGDRLHHHLDDALAGRRVHPGAASWAGSSAGCSTSSRSPSAWRSWSRASSR